MARLSVVMLLFLSSACFGGTTESVATEYISKLVKGDYRSAASLVFCGENASEAEKQNGHIGLTKELEYLAEEFGTVSKYRISKNHMYVTADLVCASMEYIGSNRPVKKVVFDVEYKDGSPGYVIVSFSHINGKFVPIVVRHGIPMRGKASIARMALVYKNLTDL